MTIEEDIAFLERVAILRVLGRPALQILAIGAESRYVHEGEVLFRKGDVADSGYVVQEGGFSLNASPDEAGRAVPVGPGALLGDIALIREGQRTATATATEPSTVIRISRSLFLKMLEGFPDAALSLRNAMAARTGESLREITRIRDNLRAAPPEE